MQGCVHLASRARASLAERAVRPSAYQESVRRRAELRARVARLREELAGESVALSQKEGDLLVSEEPRDRRSKGGSRADDPVEKHTSRT